MNPKPEMSWTCPDCQARNESKIAPEAEAGTSVEVGCRSCGTLHEASVYFARTRAGAPMTVGVVWV